jgi:hypothetical protein
VSEARLEPLRRFVFRQQLRLLIQLPLWVVLAGFLTLVAERAFRSNVVAGVLTLVGLVWGIEIGTRHSRRALRLARCCVASGAPDLAWRAALCGAVSAVFGVLALGAVLAVFSARHADELFSNMPSSEKVKGTALRLILGISIAWLAWVTWRAARWRLIWRQIKGHLPDAPGDRVLWAVFNPLYALSALRRAAMIHPQEALLYASSDNVFLTEERLIFVPLVDEGEVAHAESVPRGEVTAVGAIGAGLDLVTSEGVACSTPTVGNLLGRPGPWGFWDAFAVHWSEPSIAEESLGQLVHYLTTGAPSGEVEAEFEAARALVRPHLDEGEELLAAASAGIRRSRWRSIKDPGHLAFTTTRLFVVVDEKVKISFSARGAWLAGVGDSDEDAQDLVLESPEGRIQCRADYVPLLALLRAMIAHDDLTLVYRPIL